jgi:hypothetical protein
LLVVTSPPELLITLTWAGPQLSFARRPTKGAIGPQLKIVAYTSTHTKTYYFSTISCSLRLRFENPLVAKSHIYEFPTWWKSWPMSSAYHPKNVRTSEKDGGLMRPGPADSTLAAR